MDLLTDLLHSAGMHRRVLDLHPLVPGTAVRFPCERSIGFHVVTRGPVWVHPPAPAEPLALLTGDIAVMARGCHHLLSMSPSLEGQAVVTVSGTWGEAAARDPAEAPVPSAAAVVSGAYQFWNPPLHPLFDELPGWFVLPAADMPRLGSLALSVTLLGDEARRGDGVESLGRDALVHGLLDVLFVQLLREIVARHGRVGWSRAMRDPPVRRAVALMQADPAHPWTLESLAQAAGLSRTALAERFREAMGETPLAHLRTLRLQRAMQLLGDPRRKLEEVAQAVGYQDAFGFSKAFKRAVGLSPGEFRRRDTAERALPWRWA
jgi:AraC-like DNA-binding protein